MTAPFVVVGAGGRLGRLLSRAWSADVVTYGRADLDVRDMDGMVRALRGARAVLCLAGVTRSSDAPMTLNGALATATLDAAAAAACGRVFLMSSAAVYGRAHGVLSEDCDATPLTDYGRSKRAMERLAAGHAHANTVLRVGNVAGADAVLGGWRPGYALDVLPTGGTPRRSYVGPRTLARILETLVWCDGLPAVLNVAAPGVLAMGDLLDAAQLPWTARAAPADVIAEVALDTAALSAFIDWHPDETTAPGMVRQWKAMTDPHDLAQTDF